VAADSRAGSRGTRSYRGAKVAHMVIPQLVAHRGYPRHYPENTLIGLEAAIAAGARFVEVDVQLSRDRVPVLFHDRDLKRLCGVRGKVHDLRYEELWGLRVAERERFPAAIGHAPSLGYQKSKPEPQIDGMRLQLERIKSGQKSNAPRLHPLQYLLFGKDSHTNRLAINRMIANIQKSAFLFLLTKKLKQNSVLVIN